MEQKPNEKNNIAFQTPPATLQPTVTKSGQLTQEQINCYFQNGWLLIENFFDKNILESAKVGVSKQVDELVNKLYAAGKIQNKHEDKGFFQRMTFIEQEFPDAAVLLHKNGILPEGAKELWSYPELLNVAEQLIGPEVAGHPVWNLRVKIPEIDSGVVPWHQDNGYFTEEACNTMILTAWIPLLDTNEHNGGMQMVEGTHRDGVLGPHHCCAGDTWYIEIEKDDIEKTFQCCMKEKVRICEVPYGGVLLFNNMIVHRSSNNKSNDIRWSFDLRWQDPNKPNGREDDSEKIPVMRSLCNPVDKIDWSVLANRQHNDRKSCLDSSDDDIVKKTLADEFDTTITGSWMKRWPIKYHNKHTVNVNIL